MSNRLYLRTLVSFVFFNSLRLHLAAYVVLIMYLSQLAYYSFFG